MPAAEAAKRVVLVQRLPIKHGVVAHVVPVPARTAAAVRLRVDGAAHGRGIEEAHVAAKAGPAEQGCSLLKSRSPRLFIAIVNATIAVVGVGIGRIRGVETRTVATTNFVRGSSGKRPVISVVTARVAMGRSGGSGLCRRDSLGRRGSGSGHSGRLLPKP